MLMLDRSNLKKGIHLTTTLEMEMESVQSTVEVTGTRMDKIKSYEVLCGKVKCIALP